VRYVKAKIEGDNLRLVALPKARGKLRDMARRMELDPRDSKFLSTVDAENEILEDLRSEEGWEQLDEETVASIGALTSAPMISQDTVTTDKRGTFIMPGGRVYAFMDYQLRSFVEDLAEDGEARWDGSRVILKNEPVEDVLKEVREYLENLASSTAGEDDHELKFWLLPRVRKAERRARKKTERREARKAAAKR